MNSKMNGISLMPQGILINEHQATWNGMESMESLGIFGEDGNLH